MCSLNHMDLVFMAGTLKYWILCFSRHVCGEGSANRNFSSHGSGNCNLGADVNFFSRGHKMMYQAEESCILFLSQTVEKTRSARASKMVVMV